MGSKSKTIKKLTAGNVELKKTLASTRSELTRTQTKLTQANNKADRWRKEAAAHRTAAARSDARAERLRKKLDRATAALRPVKAAKKGSSAAPSTAYGLTAPDKTWTVVQLRAEAHGRGLKGMSGKTKKQLLAALS